MKRSIPSSDLRRLVAGQNGTNHNEVVVNSENFREGWSEAIVRRGAPVSETSDIPIFLLSKLASKTVKMVLTGEGGDELLGGYPKHRAEGAVGLYQSIMPQALHDLHCRTYYSFAPIWHASGKDLFRGCRGTRFHRSNALLVWRNVNKRSRPDARTIVVERTAGPISIFDGHRIEWSQNDVLRSSIMVAGRSSRKRRSHDDGRIR